MAKRKRNGCYAVARGRETGVFATWEEASRRVTGFSGAKFAGFATPEEAEAWLREQGVAVGM